MRLNITLLEEQKGGCMNIMKHLHSTWEWGLRSERGTLFTTRTCAESLALMTTKRLLKAHIISKWKLLLFILITCCNLVTNQACNTW
jgi:uncharacterized protein involved in tolerance to divalent cations